MEFDFDCAQVLSANENGVAVIDGARSAKRGPQHYSAGAKTHPYQKLLNEIVDNIGNASAQAQALPASVTTSIKFFAGEDRLYLLVDGFKVLGMLKTGNKNLFIRDEIGNVREIQPLCVLDFYVHESCQRSGYGKYLFEYMLDNEKVEPHKMGYDRPSSKLLKFLKKHYGLENYVPQVNNFVVFNSYFMLDKNFKTFYKDPVKAREKASPPKQSVSKYDDAGYNYKGGYDSYSRAVKEDDNSNKMPSYKQAMQMRTSGYGSQHYADASQGKLSKTVEVF